MLFRSLTPLLEGGSSLASAPALARPSSAPVAVLRRAIGCVGSTRDIELSPSVSAMFGTLSIRRAIAASSARLPLDARRGAAL